MYRRNFLIGATAITSFPIGIATVAKSKQNFKLHNIVLDAPNINNRIYPKEVVEDAIKNIFVTLDNLTQHVSPENIVGNVTDLWIHDNSVFCTVNFIDNEKAKLILSSDKFVITPVGLGNINDNVISDYKIVSMSFVDKARC